MTPVEYMTDEQFERYALEVLQRELGPDGFARFLRITRSNRMAEGSYRCRHRGFYGPPD